jgi:hypothetical protein
MGASSAEIDQEIREAREELDRKLGILESRAASGARTYGRIAAGVAVGVVAVAIGVIVYRRRRQKVTVTTLRKAVFETLRDLPDEARARFMEKLPIKIVVTDKDDEEGTSNTWSSLAQKIAPTVVGSATGAILARMRGAPPDSTTGE